MTDKQSNDNQVNPPSLPASNENPDLLEGPEKSSASPRSFDYINKVSKKSKTINKKTLLIVLAVLVLTGIIIGAISASKKSKPEDSTPIPAPETIVTPSPEASPEATDSAELDLTSYSLKVLNGSGEKGEASSVRSLLITQGFEDIDASNADNYDYTDTEVSLKDNVPETVYDAIETALSQDYTVLLDSDPLTDDSDYDVVIIVGDKQEVE